MNILICDDEIQYVEEVETTVRNFFADKAINLNIDTFSDGKELMKSSNGFYDIAFLDIKLGDVKGTQIAESIKLQNPHTLFLFITAYNQYLDDALDLRAFRFLTKPLDKERLLKGLKTAVDLIDRSTIEFIVKDGETVHKVYSGDIIYVEIIGRFTKVVTVNATMFSNDRIEFWQEKLPKANFYRIHKSYIVNTDYITKYSRDGVTLDNQYVLPIAYRERTTFRNFFLNKIEEIQK